MIDLDLDQDQKQIQIQVHIKQNIHDKGKIIKIKNNEYYLSFL